MGCGCKGAAAGGARRLRGGMRSSPQRPRLARARESQCPGPVGAPGQRWPRAGRAGGVEEVSPPSCCCAFLARTRNSCGVRGPGAERRLGHRWGPRADRQGRLEIASRQTGTDRDAGPAAAAARATPALQGPSEHAAMQCQAHHMGPSGSPAIPACPGLCADTSDQLRPQAPPHLLFLPQFRSFVTPDALVWLPRGLIWRGDVFPPPHSSSPLPGALLADPAVRAAFCVLCLPPLGGR